MDRIRGLDSLRFWMACWVCLSHVGLPLSSAFTTSGPAAKAIRGIEGNLFCGVAAVIAFFVISGFCIHYPHRQGRPLALPVFYVRRYVRMLLPLGMALVLTATLGRDLAELYGAIIWSLIAELIYYTIYPVLIGPVLCRLGWRGLLAGAFATAATVIVVSPSQLNYHGFGPALTWVVGLPCWLLGCYLADRGFGGSAPPTIKEIWAWRLGLWAASSLSSVLRFHAGVGYPITLTLLAVPIYSWLRRELHYFQAKEPVRQFESAGEFSYSIYLMHLLMADLALVALPHGGPEGFIWVAKLVVVLIGSYLFFLGVERPSHKLARHLSGLLR